MSVSMTAKKGFTNPRVTGPRPNGAVSPGESFTTDWVHGKELQQLGIAEPDDEKAFDAEPVEMMQPHNQISEPELRRVNARRAARSTGAADQKSQPETTASTGAAVPAGKALTTDMLRPPSDLATVGVKSNAPVIPPAPDATGSAGA